MIQCGLLIFKKKKKSNKVHKKVVCTVTLLQEGPGFVSMLGLFYVKLACSPVPVGSHPGLQLPLTVQRDAFHVN